MNTIDQLVQDFLAQKRIAVELCRANGIAVIPGSCPAQFLKPDFSHDFMRRLWKLLGYMKLESGS